MPILDVEIIGDLREERRDGLARRLADGAAVALGARPQGVWVKLRILPESDYAENADGPEEGVRPVFISLLQADAPGGNARTEIALSLTEVVAEACGRDPENIHIVFEPSARGRVAFGGRIVS